MSLLFGIGLHHRLGDDAGKRERSASAAPGFPSRDCRYGTGWGSAASSRSAPRRWISRSSALTAGFIAAARARPCRCRFPAPPSSRGRTPPARSHGSASSRPRVPGLTSTASSSRSRPSLTRSVSTRSPMLSSAFGDADQLQHLLRLVGGDRLCCRSSGDTRRSPGVGRRPGRPRAARSRRREREPCTTAGMISTKHVADLAAQHAHFAPRRLQPQGRRLHEPRFQIGGRDRRGGRQDRAAAAAARARSARPAR